MVCQICKVEMSAIKHNNREVTGTVARKGGGWAYTRNTVSTYTAWYCPNSFQHTVVEEPNKEGNSNE